MQEAPAKHPLAPIKLIPPTQLRLELDAHVIGQDHAKKVLSVAVYNHYKRLTFASGSPDRTANTLAPEFNDIEVEKSNIMLDRPDGHGQKPCSPANLGAHARRAVRHCRRHDAD
jgi:ATP-dependent Clp protease ATP-binding subunit ClpX